MTIHDMGRVQEKILLHTLATKQDMHALMQRKGFVQKKPSLQSEQTTRATLERLKQSSTIDLTTRSILRSGAASTTANNLAQRHTDEELLRLVGGDGREMVVYVVDGESLNGKTNWGISQRSTDLQTVC